MQMVCVSYWTPKRPETHQLPKPEIGSTVGTGRWVPTSAQYHEQLDCLQHVCVYFPASAIIIIFLLVQRLNNHALRLGNMERRRLHRKGVSYHEKMPPICTC